MRNRHHLLRTRLPRPRRRLPAVHLRGLQSRIPHRGARQYEIQRHDLQHQSHRQRNPGLIRTWRQIRAILRNRDGQTERYLGPPIGKPERQFPCHECHRYPTGETELQRARWPGWEEDEWRDADVRKPCASGSLSGVRCGHNGGYLGRWYVHTSSMINVHVNGAVRGQEMQEEKQGACISHGKREGGVYWETAKGIPYLLCSSSSRATIPESKYTFCHMVHILHRKREEEREREGAGGRCHSYT